MAPRLVLCVFFVSVGSLVMSQDMRECQMKVAKCQMLLQPLSDAANADPCSAKTPVDPCAISSKAVDCLRDNLSSCMSINEVKNLVNTLTATRDQSCSPDYVCQQKASLCTCHLRKVQPTGGDMNAETISVMCAAFNDFQACIADCADNPQVQQGLGVQIQTFASMCPKGPGPKMCLEGMTCMQEINTARGGTDIPSASFLCRSIEKLFNCLGKIKNPDCGGEENGVTFMDIKDDFLEICKDGLSRADSLTNCKDYNMCVVKNNPGMVNGSDPMKVFADIGRTSFWCTYLVHSLSCASSSADTCSLSKDLKGKLVMHERNFRETCGMQLQETKYSTPTLPHTDTSPGTITSGQRKETGAAPRLGVSSMLTTLMVMAVLLWLKV